jgi:hypothetical protein
MAYITPHHIILRRHTDAISNKDLAFLERALQHQLNECAWYYEVPRPGVTVVSPDTMIPTEEAVGIDFVDNDGIAEAVAHHGWNPGAKFPWSLIGVKEAWSWTLAASHEALEMFLNVRLDRWAVAPDGTRWPVEVADPVESYKYEVNVEMFGESRSIALSDYVLPSFWRPESTGPLDFLGLLRAPFSVAPGGYALVEREGQVVELGGSKRHGPDARPRAVTRLSRVRPPEAPWMI